MMPYLKSAAVAIAAGAAAVALSAPSASAAVPAQTVGTATVGNWNWGPFEPAPFKMSTAKNIFTVTKPGTLQVVMIARSGKGSVGIRLVTCKSKVAMTKWVTLEAKNHRYTLNQPHKLAKGTCFKVQAGRTWVDYLTGYVRGNVKWKST
ncbi:hypothetical protein NE236_25480 [Actinoallomurus purpureus]|uniref:hypothetical protein n=1 Tax=Actinoallomurus purpureus TaxID=478114 RepID=UPI0020938039|nr:hypothetical protein [Actinoallomurus purpureus]MCO6008334.1 hypothetical protein [Actinoallomurus purpureus]